MLYLVVLLLYSYKMWQDPDSYDYIKEMTCRKRTRLSGGSDKSEWNNYQKILIWSVEELLVSE